MREAVACQTNSHRQASCSETGSTFHLNSTLPTRAMSCSLSTLLCVAAGVLRYRRHYFSAIQIQRMARGNSGRRFACSRLEGYVDRQRRLLRWEQAEWENRVTAKAARRIQRQWRTQIEARAVRLEREKCLRHAKIALEQHEAVVTQARINREVHEAAVVHWYSNFFDAQRKRLDDKRSIACEKNRIWKLRLDRKKAETKERKLRREDAIKSSQKELRRNWIKTFELNIERRIVDLGTHLEQCCTAPQTSHESATRKKLFQEAKDRHLRNVLREADARGDRFETIDGLRGALDRVVIERQDADRVVALKEMKIALIEFDEKRRDELEVSTAGLNDGAHTLRLDVFL